MESTKVIIIIIKKNSVYRLIDLFGLYGVDMIDDIDYNINTALKYFHTTFNYLFYGFLRWLKARIRQNLRLIKVPNFLQWLLSV